MRHVTAIAVLLASITRSEAIRRLVELGLKAKGKAENAICLAIPSQ